MDVGRCALIMQILFDLSAFITFVAILFAVTMWAALWKYNFPVPVAELARIFTIAFLLQLMIYLVFSFLIVDIQVRMYLVRMSIVVICLSQAVPLFVSFHAWHTGKK